MPAEQHLVAGRGASVRAALEPEEADVGDVVLAAAVRAAGDVHAHAADLGEAGLFERVADRGREAARLRDREVARVGARARHDVACELGAGLGHADVVQAVVQRAEVGLVQVAQRQVLAVRDADVEGEVALDVGEGAELVGGDVAEPRVRDRADRAVGDAAHDVGFLPAVVRVAREELHRHERRPDLGGLGRAARGRVAGFEHGLGDAPRPVARAAQELALPEDALAQLVDAPSMSTSHFMRARILLSRLP